MPIERTQDRVTLTHPKGAVVEILLYGATIISWRSGSSSDPQPKERLFVSSKAALDGSKPVRGGVPVVFPCFGAPSHPDHAKLSQHGFARSEIWSFSDVIMDNDTGVSVGLTLLPNDNIKSKFDKEFELAYVVTLAEHQLTTDLHVKNNGPTSFEFQALLHNYLRAPASDVLVTPLQGLSYYDKTEATEELMARPKIESRPGVDVRTFTDSVYENAGGNYQVVWPGGGLELKVNNFKDVVVWNPQEAAGSKIGDMETGGWEKYICVEPGFVRGFASVGSGQTWVGQQVITATDGSVLVGASKV